MINIKLKDWSFVPGGTDSGRQYKPILQKYLEQAAAENTKVCLNLDGTAGIPFTFLEAVFYNFTKEEQNLITFVSEEEPDYVEDIYLMWRENERWNEILNKLEN